MKKLLALLIAVMMVVALLPATVLSVLASEIEQDISDGAGETDTPATSDPESGDDLPGEPAEEQNGNDASKINPTAPAGAVQDPVVEEGEESLPEAEVNAVLVTTPDGNARYYATLEDAFAAAVAGSVVELTVDMYAAKQIVIDRDLTIKGNGYAIYDNIGNDYHPVVWIKGNGTDVSISDLAIVTLNTGMLVSPEPITNIYNDSWAFDAALFHAENAGLDQTVINVQLDNCQILTNVYELDAYDAIDTAQGMAAFEAASSFSKGALLMRGQSVYVKITGEESVYASAAGDFTVANIGGILDIYEGLVYGHDAYQVMALYGRTDVSANADNQVRSATTAIYGGRFIAGPQVDASLIRSLRGHTLIVAGGEFLQTTSGTQVIRISDSNKAGYAYILGGNFYNDNGNGIIGYGNANVGYVRVYGGNFYAQVNPGIATSKKATYSFFYNGYETTDRLGVDAAYGMYIDAGYKVETFGYPDSPVYDANTKIDYVKKGFTNLQSVGYDESWLNSNGYIDEGVAYLVTDGEGAAPKAYYGFELERALMYLGNGGSFTLMRDITWNQPAKATKSADDTDYGVHTRCRPASAEMTFDSATKNGYYTLTAAATGVSFLTIQGGTYHFNNIGIVNTTGGVIGVYSNNNTTLYFYGGYYEANTTATASCDCLITGTSNVYLYGGSFSADRGPISITGAANIVFGIEGTKNGPTITQYGTTPNIYGKHKDITLTFYYVTFRDGGTGGQNIYFDGNCTNMNVNIYDGYYYVNNGASNYSIFATANGSSGTFNIYGGTFLRGNNGPGGTAYGKVFIFEHDGEINLYGGNYRTLVGNNVIMTIRNNNVNVTIGDKATGNGPTFQTNGGNAISVDSGYATTANIVIYGGTFTGSNAGATVMLGTNGTDKTVKSTLKIYGGSFNANASILSVGEDDLVEIYGGTFASAKDGNMITTNTGADVSIYGGSFTKTGNNIYYPGNNSTLTIAGGTFNCMTFCWSNTSANYTVNFGVPSGGSNEDINVYGTGALFGTDGKFTGNLNLNIYYGTYEFKTTGNIMYIYGSGTGSVKIHGGDFWEYGGDSRMIRIGGTFRGTFDVYGGTFKQEAGSDLICVVDNSRVDMTFGREDGTGPVMSCAKQAVLQYSYAHASTDPVSVRVLGGHYTTLAGADSVFYLGALPAGSSVVFENNPILIADEACTGYAITFTSKGANCTINGGSYYSKGNSDACFSVGAGTGTINAGYFYSNGLCVARAIGGAASTASTDLNAGYITTVTDATLVLNGGMFVLDENWKRNEAPDGDINDSVIRAGGWTGYGKVIVNNGTFVSNSGVGHRVINKYNPASTIEINGGIFMAGAVQKYYFFSTGELYDTNGNRVSGEDPDPLYVDPENDMQIVYAGKSYFALILGAAEDIKYHSVTGKGEIRIMKIELGDQDQYFNGIRFTTTITKAYLEQYQDMIAQAIDGSFGTLIVPADYLENLEGLNHAALDAAGLIYQDVAADSSLVMTENDVTFTAALTDIKEENYGRRFVAVGYVKLTVPAAPAGNMTDITPDEGETETVYIYAEYDEKGISLAELASILLENELNAVNPYSAELKALLQTFAAALPEDEAPSIKPSEPGQDDVVDDPFGSDDNDQDPPAEGGDEDDNGEQVPPAEGGDEDDNGEQDPPAEGGDGEGEEG